ncbi:MAG: hypothetical protein QM754_19980 [Tepidisphaeraceae bacterium]
MSKIVVPGFRYREGLFNKLLPILKTERSGAYSDLTHCAPPRRLVEGVAFPLIVKRPLIASSDQRDRVEKLRCAATFLAKQFSTSLTSQPMLVFFTNIQKHL